MPIVQIIVVLAVIGVLLWLVNTYIPMPAWVRKLINIVAAVGVALWLLGLVFPDLWNVRLGRRY